MNVDGVFSGHCLVDGGRPFFLPPLVSQFCWGQAGESSLWRLLSPICQWIRGCLGCVGSPSGDVRLGGVDLLGSVSLHFSSNLEKLWPPRPHFSPHDRPVCRDRVVGASSRSRRGAARGRSGAPFSVPPAPGASGFATLRHACHSLHLCLKQKKMKKPRALHFSFPEVQSFFHTSHVSAQHIRSFLWRLGQSPLWTGPCLWILSAVSVRAHFWLLVFLRILRNLSLAL